MTYTVNVQAVGQTSGSFLLGFYLPGDANGDGTVNNDRPPDRQEACRRPRRRQSNYNFNADANRDGRIGKIDLAFTLQNQGVSTNVTPIVQANYNTSHDVPGRTARFQHPLGPLHRDRDPGATITYTEVNDLVPATTTTADCTGNYSITVPLATGSNTFKVTATDAFGQDHPGDPHAGVVHKSCAGQCGRERLITRLRPNTRAGLESSR